MWGFVGVDGVLDARKATKQSDDRMLQNVPSVAFATEFCRFRRVHQRKRDAQENGTPEIPKGVSACRIKGGLTGAIGGTGSCLIKKIKKYQKKTS